MGAACWVGEGGDRGEEERAFELFVVASGWAFAAHTGAGASGDGSQAGVGGEVARGGAKAVPSPTSSRIRAAVLTPMRGVETSDLVQSHVAAVMGCRRWLAEGLDGVVGLLVFEVVVELAEHAVEQVAQSG